jgi:hypothetical protein
MAFSKNLFALTLTLLVLQQTHSFAKTDTLINIKSLKININYIKRYIMQNEVRRAFYNYGGNPNAGFTGDTAALSTLDKGFRLGADYDLPLFKVGVLRNFSLTFGLWYQSTKSETIYYSTSKVNSNGSPRQYGTFYSSRFSSLMALNYYYHKVRFTFGGNINLYRRDRFELIYSDGLIENGFETLPASASFLYSSFEFPILFKNKLSCRAIASFNRRSTIFAGLGLVYRIKSF